MLVVALQVIVVGSTASKLLMVVAGLTASPILSCQLGLLVQGLLFMLHCDPQYVSHLAYMLLAYSGAAAWCTLTTSDTTGVVSSSGAHSRQVPQAGVECLKVGASLMAVHLLLVLVHQLLSQNLKVFAAELPGAARAGRDCASTAGANRWSSSGGAPVWIMRAVLARQGHTGMLAAMQLCNALWLVVHAWQLQGSGMNADMSAGAVAPSAWAVWPGLSVPWVCAAVLAGHAVTVLLQPAWLQQPSARWVGSAVFWCTTALRLLMLPVGPTSAQQVFWHFTSLAALLCVQGHALPWFSLQLVLVTMLCVRARLQLGSDRAHLDASAAMFLPSAPAAVTQPVELLVQLVPYFAVVASLLAAYNWLRVYKPTAHPGRRSAAGVAAFCTEQGAAGHYPNMGNAMTFTRGKFSSESIDRDHGYHAHWDSERAAADTACSLAAASFATWAKLVLARDILRVHTDPTARYLGLLGCLITWSIWVVQASCFLLVPRAAKAARDSSWPSVVSLGTASALLLETVLGVPRLWAPPFSVFMVAASCGLMDVQLGPLSVWLPVMFMVSFGVHAWDTRATASFFNLAAEAAAMNIMPLAAYLVVKFGAQALRYGAVLLASLVSAWRRGQGSGAEQLSNRHRVMAVTVVQLAMAGLLLALPQHKLPRSKDVLEALSAVPQALNAVMVHMTGRLGSTTKAQEVSLVCCTHDIHGGGTRQHAQAYCQRCTRVGLCM